MRGNIYAVKYYKKILQKHAYEILHKHVAGSGGFLHVFLLFFGQQI